MMITDQDISGCSNERDGNLGVHGAGDGGTIIPKV